MQTSSALINAKKREKERQQGGKGKAQGAKPPNPIPSNRCAHREGRTERKQKKEKETGRGSTTQHHSVVSYDTQGSYGKPILFTSLAHALPPMEGGGEQEKIYIIYIYVCIYIYNFLL